MKKSKISKMSWTGFFPNLMGVVLGILLTFGVNSLWQRHEDKKKIKEILILIRNEMETDRNWFKNMEKEMKKDCYVYRKFLDANGDWSKTPEDTLVVHHNRMISWRDWQLTTSAWQIFQNSEIIHKMPDKELVIRLTDSYSLINNAREIFIREYWDRKKKVNNYIRDPYKFLDAVKSNNESDFFFEFITDKSNGLWDIFPLVDATIDYSISLLDKEGDYSYDMGDKDKEYEAFKKERIDSVRQSRYRTR